MRFAPNELEFFCAWAREEKAVDPYVLSAHQLQLAHKIPGATLIRAIKAWSREEGRKDEDIFDLFDAPTISWPWESDEDLAVKAEAVAKEIQA